VFLSRSTLFTLLLGAAAGAVDAAPNGERAAGFESRIATKRTESATVLFQTHTGPYWTAGPVLRQVAEYMAQNGEPGPMYVRYERDVSAAGASSLRSEVGYYAEGKPAPGPTYAIGRRESERVAYVVVDARELATPMLHRAMMAWIHDQRLTPVGPITEIHWPATTARGSDAAIADRIEIQAPIVEGDAAVPSTATAAATTAPTAEEHAEWVGSTSIEAAATANASEPAVGSRRSVASESSVAPDPPSASGTGSIVAPQSAETVAELVAAHRFDEMATRLLPDDRTPVGVSRTWLGQIVLRLDAVASGAALAHPDKSAAIDACCAAVRRRYDRLPLTAGPDPRDLPTIAAGVGPERRAIVARIDRLLSRIASRTVSPAGILGELASTLDQVDARLNGPNDN
jgi:hypothetical protein